MQAARSFTADVSIAGTELAFGYLLLAAYFTGKIINRFGLPKLTGYLISGVISGPFLLGFVTTDMSKSLEVVSSTATAILALEAGSELQLKKIKPVLKTLRSDHAVRGRRLDVHDQSAALFVLRPMGCRRSSRGSTSRRASRCAPRSGSRYRHSRRPW